MKPTARRRGELASRVNIRARVNRSVVQSIKTRTTKPPVYSYEGLNV